jgi:hypothetical protein
MATGADADGRLRPSASAEGGSIFGSVSIKTGSFKMVPMPVGGDFSALDEIAHLRCYVFSGSPKMVPCTQ